MNFIDTLLDHISDFGSLVKDGFVEILDFISKPMGYILEFFEGIFYLLFKLGELVILVINLFTALFQFFFSLVAVLTRTLLSWLNPISNTGMNYSYETEQGLEVFKDVIGNFGYLDVIPFALTAIVYVYMSIKILGLLGDGGTK